MVSAVEQFGMNLRAARIAKGWTQERLAQEVGTSPVQISRIERGKREIRLTTLLRLARALELPGAALLENVGME